MNKLLVITTGSVATTKVPQVVQKLCADYEIHLVLTEAAKRFISGKEAPFACQLAGEANIYEDELEQRWQRKGDVVWHIHLTTIADALVVIPASADFLAKIRHGLANDLASCCARAWDFSKPCMVFPSMNTKMWEHPVTKEHLDVLHTWGFQVVPPISKMLACGVFGIGALPEIHDCITRIHAFTALL
ncbi:phosphopantothenoylcysteine decarboxylase [Gregarina niphandrodes]|uniref:Phosphopantothenoylcysteine decarboxylase n=1 Tax=Gregarina niphandrodes TaxID=110365 RepID=A0A023BBY6_GRENI|nr:phosphopantothenoylcysteine decarboxylase [Gregarina niphandrodes]EZG81488.1 phosphopantothenoylcysteine decarboxylase [Gregarina niphandrodes]|eukprot:XP_011134225.1 phosphopantothenoylcysteine decarboxylase [Gregarina niphandrodes]